MLGTAKTKAKKRNKKAKKEKKEKKENKKQLHGCHQKQKHRTKSPSSSEPKNAKKHRESVPNHESPLLPKRVKHNTRYQCNLQIK